MLVFLMGVGATGLLIAAAVSRDRTDVHDWETTRIVTEGTTFTIILSVASQRSLPLNKAKPIRAKLQRSLILSLTCARI
jgi:hypothetical protein